MYKPKHILVLWVFFMASVSFAQSSWQWAKNLGNNRTTHPAALATDGNSNVVATGSFSPSSLTVGTATLTNNGYFDAWLAQYSSSGTLKWALSFGGSTGNESGTGLAIDASNNIYVCGTFTSTTMPIGTTTLTSAGGVDIFLAKFDVNGNFLWANSYGNTGNEYATGLSADASGNVLMTGYYGTGTSLTLGATTLTNAGNNDLFVCQVNSSGTVVWATKFGGTGNDYATGVKVDNSNNVLVTGYFSSASMIVSTNTLSTSGSYDCFIAKLSNAGVATWGLKFGGTSTDYSWGVTIDASNNIFVSGQFYSSTVAVGTTTLTNTGTTSYADVFVCEYNSSGTAQWAKSLGGTSNEYAYGITTDASGNVYVPLAYTSSTITVGPTTYTNGSYSGSTDYLLTQYSNSGTLNWSTSSSANGVTVWSETPYAITTDASNNIIMAGALDDAYTVGTVTFTTPTGDDAYIIKYNNTPTTQWGVQLNGINQGTSGQAIYVDATGNTYVGGYFFTSTMVAGTSTLTNAGNADGFYAVYNSSGIAQYGVGVGGKGSDYIYAIAVDGSDNVYVGGYFNGPLVIGTTTLTPAGNNDAFVAKYNSAGAPQWAMRIGGVNNDFTQSIAVDASNNIYVTGYFNGTTAIGTNTLVSNNTDVFITEINSAGTVQWAKKYGGNGTDVAYSVALDGSNNVILSGYFSSTNNSATGFIVGSNTLTTTGSNDGFVAKLNNSGLGQWAAKTGGTGADYLLSVTAEKNNNGYITACGYFTSSTMTIGTNTYTNGSTGSNTDDGYCVSYDASGNILWSQQQSGTGNERITSVKNSPDGDVFWSAYFGSNTINVTGSITLTNSSTISSGPSATGTEPIDMYFMKQDDTTGAFGPNAIQVTGTSSDNPNAIFVDNTQNLYVTGNTWSSPLTFGSNSPTFSFNSSPMVVAKLGNLGTLPIELLSFNASKTGNMVLVNWQTETETYNHYFLIERSTDGTHFCNIGKVEGAGNSTTVKEYMLIDSFPKAGINYYRLKQVDYNGKSTIPTPIKSVDFENNSIQSIKVYPNPAKKTVYIEMTRPDELQTISLLDVSGRLVIQTTDRQINIESLQNGVYFIQVNTSSEIFKQKLIKQN